MKVIQKICTSAENAIYICGFEPESGKLKFRTSFEPNYLQEEVVSINEKGQVYTALYNFHINFLHKYIEENSIAGV